MTTYSLKKKIIFIIIMILLPLIIAFSLAEAYIRLTKNYYTPEIIKMKSLQYSSALFARHVFPLKEQHIKEKGWFINSKGYRGENFKTKKDVNKIRVMVYGGSAVFDPEVTKGNDWPKRVGALMKEKGISNIEVINAGIPGHATFDSFGRLFTEGHIFQPDYVILYNAWNDIKYFSHDQPLLRKFKPFKEASDFRSNYHNTFDRLLCETSQIYVRLRHRYYKKKYRLGKEGVFQEGQSNREINEAALKQYRLNTELFVDLAKNINAIPILVTQARLVSNDNTDQEKSKISYHYQRMQHQTLVKAFEKIDEIIDTVAKSKQVPMIDASKQMTGNVEYFDDHIHLTSEGSKRLSIIIANHLFSIIKK